MAARPVDDPNGLAALLADRERDLELAAKIGQQLLEQNKELNVKNEYLEERLASSSDTVIQLQHELKTHIELLRVYSHYDDDLPDAESPTDSKCLRSRIERLNTENEQLRRQTETMKSAAAANVMKGREHCEELSRQLDVANGKVTQLQTVMATKAEECAAQTSAVERLLDQISHYHGRHNEVVSENENLQRQLEQAVNRQEFLQKDMSQMQEQYAELRGLFAAAEEELVRFRTAPPRSHSNDSLYDSLLSEMENSDSGFSSTPGPSARGHKSLHLELAGLDLSPVTEISKVPSTSTPLSVQIPETPLPSKGRAPLTCDASTSTAALEVDSGIMSSAGTTSSPRPEKPPATLEFSAMKSVDCSPSTPIRPLGLAAIAARSTSLLGKSPLAGGSQESLENYVAPRMGEPGVPGTRDLYFSLKRLQARRQVEKEYASFLRRRGLQPKSFFSNLLSRQSSHVDESSSVDWSISFGLEHNRNTMAATKPVGCVAGLAPIKSGTQGVLTRAELSSPNSSPIRLSPSLPTGLASLLPASMDFSMGGIAMASKMPADSSRGLTLIPCSYCSAVPLSPNDTFCRKCGNRLSLECSQCNAILRVEDTFCPKCGHRRIAAFDVFRYGLRARTSGTVLITALLAGSAWILLRYALRKKL